MILIDNQYGNWKVIKQAKSRNKKSYYLCICNCGIEKEVRGDILQTSNSQNCRNCRFVDKQILPGTIFGKWTVLQEIKTTEKRKHYKVKCECGIVKILKGIRLRFGDSIQCRKCGSTKHNMVHSKTYSSWESMIQRCTNINHQNYKHYGKRNIKVCDKWLKFENFLEDMGERPENLELDRIDNNGNYEKSNCRWITHKENLNNRSRS